ncbi:unnamed protein product [Soboliphyme baturini]|uniref:Vacuolar protein sorting-associated protein 51 homolog n=1 Tax=Soboliphyme baturini TaxID=241478 RepID=A0A183JB76_9BILA|nr:unnamed protein product [Soboliphyme baturini]
MLLSATAKFLKAKFSKEHSELASDESQAKPTDATGQSQTFVQTLNSSEDLYAELRNLNFNAVATVLREKVKNVSEQIEEKNRATTIMEYKEFVKKLPALQVLRSSVSVHTTVAEMVKEFTRSIHFLDTLKCEQGTLCACLV